MKKLSAFTLIEIVVAITLFSLVILFLYQSLSVSQKSTDFFSQKVENVFKKTQVRKTLFLDFINQEITAFKIYTDKNQNTIVSLSTKNSYHNPFYNHVTYLLSKENNLIRIESLHKFEQTKLNDAFFETAYIDVIEEKIETFKVKQNEGKTYFYINSENGDKTFFSF